MKKQRKEWETNRDLAKRPKKVKFWCWGCDGYLVGPGEKCPRCGYTNYPYRRKKE
jgi:hypothetical protein